MMAPDWVSTRPSGNKPRSPEITSEAMVGYCHAGARGAQYAAARKGNENSFFLRKGSNAMAEETTTGTTEQQGVQVLLKGAVAPGEKKGVAPIEGTEK